MIVLDIDTMRNGLTPVKEKDTVHSMENHRGMSEAISISIQMTQVLYKSDTDREATVK